MINITIDPGLGGTGYAIWDSSKWKETVPPISTGVLKTGTHGEWYERALEMSLQFEMMLKEAKADNFSRIHIVWIEMPQLMTSVKGAASATKGDVFKLTVLVGFLMKSAYLAEASEVLPIDVNRWKGTMSKEAVQARIRARLGGIGYANHAADAVGIGLFLKGALNASGTTRITG